MLVALDLQNSQSSPQLSLSEEDLDARIRHKNQPVLISVFRDPETEEEKVCDVAALPGGVSNVEFSLIGTGPGTNKNYLFLAANCLLH